MIDTNYQRSVDDYLALQLHLLDRSNWYKKQRLLVCFAVPIVFFGISALFALTAFSMRPPPPDHLLLLAGVFAIMGLMVAVIYPFTLRPMTMKRMKQYVNDRGTRGLHGDYHLILSDKVMAETVDERKIEIPWRHLERIDETASHTFVFMDPSHAFIWPMNGFRTEDEYRQVVDYAKQRFTHFHGST